MNENLKDILSILSDIATILAFAWAVYEFYIKRRFKIKATAFPLPLNKSEKEYLFSFKVINLSDQSLKRIDYIGLWIERKNSFGQFWEIALKDVSYQEKTVFTENILPFLNSAVQQCCNEQTRFDKLVKPKLKIVLRTTIDREIKVTIDDFFQKQVDDKIDILFKKYEIN
ncbi:hypothetical protein SJPD1_1264 [Sulfurospirillum diekertiae]|uniref:Uncharacterized protein n=1 Tax=Sulfurospirillum diekertiae TaxID=1854492 RepID=A0A290HRV9_9BACT|nr:hypothetical protein [Sulfurospirillum diekertiae]ATB69374.1 hypothetical protein SJPD1_1264 [Sulfurospirillum diekertiae]